MKITLLVLVLLIALSTKPLSGAAGAAPEQVVDISGKKLRAGVNYNIVPVSDIAFFTVYNIGNQTCPYDVMLAEGNPSYGLPVVFTPVNAKKGVVRVNTDLNIDYSSFDDSDCPNSNVWKLKDYDYSTGKWFVTTGGVLGNPGRETIGNWFKIEKYEDSYKLSYCPSVCKDCSYPCMDVGIYDDQQYGNKRLGLSYLPYKVRFQLSSDDDD